MNALAALPDGRPAQHTDVARRVVVVLDGRETSDAALIAACQLTPTSQLHVLSVANPAPIAAAPGDVGQSCEWIGRQRERIEAQMKRVLGAVEMRLDIRSGSAPATIAAYAQAIDASLLITALGVRAASERPQSDESAYHIARLSAMPVLGVSTEGGMSPVRVMVAMDASAASWQAATIACQIAAPDARIMLVHVRSPLRLPLSPSTLAARAEALQRGHFGRVEMVQLDGDPATELLAFANARGVDLIAVGRSGETTRPRGVIGAVATRLIRGAQCSVLEVSA